MNSNSDMDRAVHQVLKLVRESGAAFLFIYHLPKSAEWGTVAARGAVALQAAMDILLSLYVEGSEDSTKRLLVAKTRYDETPRRLVVDYDVTHRTYSLVESPPATHPVSSLDKLLAAIDGTPRSAEELANRASIARSTARDLLRDLRETGQGQVEWTGDAKKGAGAYRYFKSPGCLDALCA